MQIKRTSQPQLLLCGSKNLIFSLRNVTDFHSVQPLCSQIFFLFKQKYSLKKDWLQLGFLEIDIERIVKLLYDKNVQFHHLFTSCCPHLIRRARANWHAHESGKRTSADCLHSFEWKWDNFEICVGQTKTGFTQLELFRTLSPVSLL